jgi:hypothetical protein
MSPGLLQQQLLVGMVQLGTAVQMMRTAAMQHSTWR